MVIDRFTTPLYGIAEAARYLAVPPSTFTTWAFGYQRRRRDGRAIEGKPVITAARPDRPNEAAVPFIGLAEGFALAAFRQAGVPLQRIRPAIDALEEELGLAHALASRRLFTDGAEVLYDYAEHVGDESARELVVVRNNQRVFSDIVASYLRRVDFASDGYAQVITLPQYRTATVTVDAAHAFGRPRFTHGGAKLEDVIDLFQAGEPVDVVAEEFGLSRDEVEDALRVATRTAA
ncbi:putative antitoxin VapB45 [Sphaerisporangium rufum]|uniref:Antitoxin VapB45 n=2 Tax=Sphaerisporangium rufum TaxID=1381558 RepID=A0A919V0S7_9ACTN|nr:putative antitoxin VapB45 [Sphaerisporangium rufum]